jgi:hypothetical protein
MFLLTATATFTKKIKPETSSRIKVETTGKSLLIITECSLLSITATEATTGRTITRSQGHQTTQDQRLLHGQLLHAQHLLHGQQEVPVVELKEIRLRPFDKSIEVQSHDCTFFVFIEPNAGGNLLWYTEKGYS